jgi:hypothetical protein
MADRPDKPPEMGKKSRAGNLLSSYLRAIAQEEVAHGSGRMMCKAEALAHLIWDKALGYKETLPDGEEVYHEPDKDMIKLVYDRMEGKVTNSEETKDRGQTLPEKVSDTNKGRMNKIAEKSGNN